MGRVKLNWTLLYPEPERPGSARPNLVIGAVCIVGMGLSFYEKKVRTFVDRVSSLMKIRDPTQTRRDAEQFDLLSLI